MTRLEAILKQAYALTPAEREELIRALSTRASSGRGTGRASGETGRETGASEADDDAAVGARGLASWTESTRGEDWSMYYPGALPNGGRAVP